MRRPLVGDDRAGRQLQLAPPDDVGEVAEGADHGDARALLGVGQRVGADLDLDAEQRRAHRRAEQRLVALVVGVGDEGDAGRDQLGPGGLDEDRLAVVGAAERDAVVGAGHLAVLELGLGDRGAEVDVPQHRRLGLVGLAPRQVAQERPLGDPPRRARRWSCRSAPSRPTARGVRHRSSKACSSSAVRPFAQLDEVAARDAAAACLPAARRAGSNVGVVGERRVALDAVVVLDPALGGQAVVVPAHRVEDLLAPHALVAGDGVGVGVARTRGRRAASRSPSAAACRWSRPRRGSWCGRSGRCPARPRPRPSGPRCPSRVGLVGDRPVGVAGEPGAGSLRHRRQGSGRSRPLRSGTGFGRRGPATSLPVLQLFDTAQGQVVPFEPREPGKVSMYVCGPTVYGPPHLGPRPLLARVRRAAPLPRVVAASRSPTSPTSPTSTTTSSTGPTTRAARPTRSPASASRSGARPWTASASSARPTTPTPPPTSSRWSRSSAELVARGDAYETDDGVYFTPEVVADYGLLARQSIDSLRPAPGSRPTTRSARPIDFVLWKKAKPGEPSWPSPWGDGPPGLAHRVRRHVARPAGRRLRPPRRRPGPRLPPPRERAGPGRGRRAHLRPPLGAQRLRRGRRREDVEEPRQLHQPARPHRVDRPPRLPAAGAAQPLPLAGRGHQGHHRRRGGRAASASTSSPAAPATCPAAEPDADGARRVPRGHGRRPRHAAARSPCCSPSCARATSALDDGDDVTAAPLRGHGARDRRARWASSWPGPAAGLVADDEAAASGPPSATRPAPPRTGPRPIACATSSRPMGYVVEDTAAGTQVRRPDARRASAGGARDLTGRRRSRSLAAGASVDRRRVRARAAAPGFGIIWTTVAVDLIGFGIVLPILPQYAERFGVSATRHRPAGGVVLAGPADLFAPIWGRLSDRIGRKPVLLISLFGTAVGSLLTGVAGSIWLLFLGRHRRRRLGRERVGGPGRGGRRGPARRTGPGSWACSARPSASGSWPARPSARSARSVGPHVPFFVAAAIVVRERRWWPSSACRRPAGHARHRPGGPAERRGRSRDGAGRHARRPAAGHGPAREPAHVDGPAESGRRGADAPRDPAAHHRVVRGDGGLQRVRGHVRAAHRQPRSG